MTDTNSIPTNNEGAFGVPGNYFVNSAQQLMQRIAWEDEHTALPLLKASRKNAFVVPEHYEFAEGWCDRTLYSELYAVVREPVFEVPENYFESSRYALVNGGEGTPSINIPKIELGFDVPSDYFNTTAADLQKQLLPNRNGRVVALFRTASMAAAAVLLVVIALMGYRLYHRPVAEGDCGTIACLDRKELMQQQTFEAIENDELFDIVNPADLEKHLNGPKKNTNDSNDLLNELYEEELDS